MPQLLRPSEPVVSQVTVLVAPFVTLAVLNAFGGALLAGRLRRAMGRPAVLRAMTRAAGAAVVAKSDAAAPTRRVA